MRPIPRRRLPRGGVDRNQAASFTSSSPVVSPPSRRRGSKRARRHRTPPSARVASLAEAWIETLDQAARAGWRRGRLPRGGVDRNVDRQAHHRTRSGRLPRGGVDRNGSSSDETTVPRTVASLKEAWIETPWRDRPGRAGAVASLADEWIETGPARGPALGPGRLPRGGVD